MVNCCVENAFVMLANENQRWIISHIEYTTIGGVANGTLSCLPHARCKFQQRCYRTKLKHWIQKRQIWITWWTRTLQMGGKKHTREMERQREKERLIYSIAIFPSIQFELLSIIYRILTEFKGYKSYKSKG